MHETRAEAEDEEPTWGLLYRYFPAQRTVLIQNGTGTRYRARV